MSQKKYFKGIHVVVDTLWGDSGKGKIVDIGAQNTKAVVRFNGGDNAGHTINNNKGEFKLHLIPSGIFNPKTLCIIDSGVVVNPFVLEREIKELRSAGIPVSGKNLMVSRRSHLVLPWHVALDALRESLKKKNKIGTTGRGIGPAYADKTAREGLRIDDLFEKDFKEKFEAECARQNYLIRMFGGKPLHRGNLYSQLKKLATFIRPFTGDTFSIIQHYVNSGKSILGEGAQGGLLDINLGGYPYVTSSHPTIPGFTLSTGIHDHSITNVIGVTKAYATRVGEGPMPTEQSGKIGARLLDVGREYGTTTGRARRCGWFDLPLTRYGSLITGARTVALTKLDVLDSFEEIKVCTDYKIKDKKISMPPDADTKTLKSAVPVYETLPGWKKDITKVKKFKDLPANAKKYVLFLEKKLGMRIDIISVGPSREQTIFR